MISLLHSSGSAGTVVGGDTDRCDECVRLRAEQHAGWACRDYLRAIAAQHRSLDHFAAVHACQRAGATS